MKWLKVLIYISAIAVISLSHQSCNIIKQVSQTISNLQKLEYKIENVTNFRVANINVQNISSLKDFSITDGLKLANAYATKSFPADFVLNLNAKNPNTGSNNTTATSATIAKLDYRLILDEKPTISGDISSPITVPGTGQSINIPLNMNLDLYKFFGDRGYESVINLALSLGGLNANPTKVKLDIKPTVNTSIGPISYPNRITVIDKEWR